MLFRVKLLILDKLWREEANSAVGPYKPIYNLKYLLMPINFTTEELVMVSGICNL